MASGRTNVRDKYVVWAGRFCRLVDQCAERATGHIREHDELTAGPRVRDFKLKGAILTHF